MLISSIVEFEVPFTFHYLVNIWVFKHVNVMTFKCFQITTEMNSLRAKRIEILQAMQGWSHQRATMNEFCGRL